MLQELARELHLSWPAFYLICVLTWLLLAVAAGLILKQNFHRWSVRLQHSTGQILFAILEALSIPLLILTAVYLGLEVLTLPPQYKQVGSKAIFALVVIVIFYFLTKVIALFLGRWGQKNPALVRVTQPASFLMRMAFALLAAIIVLENLGIHLTAVWTTLGVGSVAVALALQDTLGNFFAGLYLMADHPINPNDYIRLDGGQEGYVVHVGGRSTSIRTLGNNTVVIPNSTLAKAIITNYSIPEERMSLNILVSAAYGSDPRRVEAILKEVALQAARDAVAGLLENPPPVARLIPGFGPSSLDFTLTVQIDRFSHQYEVQSELRKRVLERLIEEGVEMPFPTQTILLSPTAPNSPPGTGYHDEAAELKREKSEQDIDER